MITTRSLSGQTWIDLHSPTQEEADSLMMTQGLGPAIAKDLLTPTPMQYAEESGSVIYAVLHIPTFKHSHAAENMQEIDFVISQNGVITARYDSVDALHYFAKQMEVSEILSHDENSHLFFLMMKAVYKSMLDELAYMEDWSKEIEKSIFAGREKEMVQTLSNISRNILNFKRIVDRHGDILEFIKETGREKYGEDFGVGAKGLLADWRHIMKKVDNHTDMISELRETNNSLLSTKQNEIMKNLTVIGSILLPLTLIGQIFGLSINAFPFKNHPDAFWFILAIMAVVALIATLFAKIRKWM